VNVHVPASAEAPASNEESGERKPRRKVTSKE